jgi:hypothetical protein
MKTQIKNQARNLLLTLMTIGLVFLFQSCTKENMKNFNSVRIEATDAPIDDAQIEAVFVTITEVKVDGKQIDGFNKSTIQLSALVEGKTEILGEAETEAESINQIEVTIDFDNNAENGGPGTFVLLKDGSIDVLGSGSTEIVLNKNFDLSGESNSSIVVDFDLRKMIGRTEDKGYELDASLELDSEIKAMVKGNAGSLEGSIDNADSTNSTFIAFLYVEGEFNASAEKQEDQMGRNFLNAEASTKVNADGSFKFGFVEEGEYDLIIIEFEDKDNDGEMEVKGQVKISSQTDINGTLGGIKVEGNSNTDVDIEVDALFPL